MLLLTWLPCAHKGQLEVPPFLASDVCFSYVDLLVASSKILISISLKEVSEKDKIGFQELLRKLQHQINYDLLLHSLEESDLEKLIISNLTKSFL